MSTWKDVRGPAWVLALVLGLGMPSTVAAGQPGDGFAAVPALERGRETAGLSARTGTLSAGHEPFGLPASDSPAAYAEKWLLVVRAIASEEGILARCRAEPNECPQGALRFLKIVEAARNKEGRARLGEVNRAVNMAIRYRSDTARHGSPDAWTAPLSTFASGEGDCEDYAIAKYVALREAGVPAQDLRLVLVRDTKLAQDHAIIAARLEGRWLILDNRRLILLDHGDVRSYRPITAFGPDNAPFHLAADDAESDSDADRGIAGVPEPNRS